MLGIPRTYAGGQWQHNLPATPSVAANGNGALITASGTTHTKGSYTEIVAVTTYEWNGFWLWVGDTSTAATATNVLLDVAIGAAGSEQVILPDFMVGYRGSLGANIPHPVFIPLHIPRGSRIACRCQAQIASDTVRVVLFGQVGNSGLPVPLFTNCDAYGISAATSAGVSHTPGNTGAESTAANIGGTTSKPYGAVFPGITPAGTSVTNIGYHWELMIGGSTIAEWWTANDTSERLWGPIPQIPINVSIPTGTQLQIRGEASGTAQAHSTAFYCFY